jgi:hypothetical protein
LLHEKVLEAMGMPPDAKISLTSDSRSIEKSKKQTVQKFAHVLGRKEGLWLTMRSSSLVGGMNAASDSGNVIDISERAPNEKISLTSDSRSIEKSKKQTLQKSAHVSGSKEGFLPNINRSSLVCDMNAASDSGDDSDNSKRAPDEKIDTKLLAVYPEASINEESKSEKSDKSKKKESEEELDIDYFGS